MPINYLQFNKLGSNSSKVRLFSTQIIAIKFQSLDSYDKNGNLQLMDVQNCWGFIQWRRQGILPFLLTNGPLCVFFKRIIFLPITPFVEAEISSLPISCSNTTIYSYYIVQQMIMFLVNTYTSTSNQISSTRYCKK